MAARDSRTPHGGGCLLGALAGFVLWLLLWRACA